MADMTRIKGRIQEVIRPNGVGAITAAEHQSLLLEMVDDINTKKADQSELIATQESLEELTDTVNNLPQGEEFDKQGNYPLLHVGTADDLAGRGESVPAEFGFRASGGKSIKDGRAYIKRIKGNSVVWNNMIDTRGYEGGFFTDVPFDIIQGHKYLLQRTHANDGIYLIPVINGEEKYEMSLQSGKYAAIYESLHTGDSTRVFAEAYCGACVISDLTKMFGEGNEPSTIEEYEARKPIVEDEYAYNEGQVIHCNTESIKSIGDNAFNGVWYQGGVSDNDGNINTSQLDYLYTDTFRVIGGETYCSQYDGADLHIKGFFYDKSGAFIGSSDFDVLQGTKKWVAPINADSVRMRIFNGVGNITPSQAPNVMIRLDHSGWKSNTGVGYEPYWQDTLPLPIIRKYFPQGMKSAGTAHDEIRYNKASGKWEAVQRISSVDMGSLPWARNANGSLMLMNATIADIAPALTTATYTNNILQIRYPFDTSGGTTLMSDKTIRRYSRNIYVRDDAYTDAASFKSDMVGVPLYYEIAEPIVTELDAEDQNFRDYYQVADFGTEQSQSNVPSAPFSADIIYQFNAVDMIREHEIEITELQSIITEQQSVIATMQAQLTSLINGGQ